MVNKQNDTTYFCKTQNFIFLTTRKKRLKLGRLESRDSIWLNKTMKRKKKQKFISSVN